MYKDIVIIGAGITGLGSSWQLLNKETEGWKGDWIVLERAEKLGGNALSETDKLGFTWDIGSHVIYSHYEYFDNVLSTIMDDDEWQFNERSGWIWMFDQFIPYPIQRNIRYFPEPILSSCVNELTEIYKTSQRNTNYKSLEDWLIDNFGPTLVKEFFAPFNYKMWARPINRLSTSWVQLRSGGKNNNTPMIELDEILQSIIGHYDLPGWNSRDKFPYPKSGGCGKIMRRLGSKIPSSRISLKSVVTSISTSNRELTLKTGKTIKYGSLISTIPLPILLSLISDQPILHHLNKEIEFSGAHVIGIAYQGKLPQYLNSKNWLYFPQGELPFFRVSIISNYSKYNVPDSSKYWSLLCEISSSEYKPINEKNLIENVIKGLYQSVVPLDSKVINIWHKKLKIGYPVPFLGRDALLSEVQGRLAEEHIFSRGRLGGMKYESSNLDYSFMQGVEVVDRILEGKEEISYFSPELV